MIDPLQDAHGRPITYLRLSVTDRCQFRCLYCVPAEGAPLASTAEYLSVAEMERLITALAAMGVWRLRLTGGEPLLRHDIVALVARFAKIPGIRDLALSTNGEHLAPIAQVLKDAGLARVNVSLDSLDPARFQTLTHSRAFEKVWQGIYAALAAGLKVKLNVVALKGLSETEIDGFAALAWRLPLEVRFIEFMPLCGSSWNPELVLPIVAVRDRIGQRFALKRLFRGSEVAESYELVGGRGRVGFIGSMTEPFCSRCSRIRVNAVGKIQTCLFSKLSYDIRAALGADITPAETEREIRRIVLMKPKQHAYVQAGWQHPEPAHGLMRAMGG